VAKGVIMRNKAPPKKQKHPYQHPEEVIVVDTARDTHRDDEDDRTDGKLQDTKEGALMI
jgi:hypothetical protein